MTRNVLDPKSWEEAGYLQCRLLFFLRSVSVFVFVFVFLPFLGLLPRHMEIPRLRGLIGAIATSLCQSHSNVGSKPRLQPTPQFTATPDP